MRSEAGLFLFLLLGTLVVIVVSLYFRYRNLQMFHQERMAALDKGTTVPAGHTFAPWSPRVYLLRGLLWSFAGLALMVSLLGIAASTRSPESAESTLWRAKSLARSLGVSAEEAKQIVEQDRNSRRNGVPYSVALLGLIPFGVGMAYLVFYYTGEKSDTRP